MTDPPAPDPACGVFSTMLVVRGVAVALDGHLARLRASARALYGAELPADAAARAAERARPFALGRLRLSVVPRAGGGIEAEIAAQPVEQAVVLPAWERALDLRPAVVAGWSGAHKWADRRLLDGLERAAAPASAVLLDAEHGVLETTRANVFAVDARGAIATPPLDGRILPGVARAHVLEIARERGVPVHERPLAPADALAAAELFTTGAVRGIEHVRSFGERRFERPGALAAMLQSALRERWLGGGAPSRGDAATPAR